MDKKQLKEYQKQLRERFFSVQFDNKKTKFGSVS